MELAFCQTFAKFVPPVTAGNISSQIAGRELAIALCAMHILLIAAQLRMVTGAASALNRQVVVANTFRLLFCTKIYGHHCQKTLSMEERCVLKTWLPRGGPYLAGYLIQNQFHQW